LTESSAAADPLALFVCHNGRLERHPLPEGPSVVGRAKDCDIVVDDVSVSRQHAAVIVSKGHITLVDLASRNRTLLNGKPIEKVAIALGDVVTFGSIAAMVRHADDEPQMLSLPKATRKLSDFPGTDQPSSVEAPRLIRLLSEVGRTLVGTLTLDELLSRVIDLLFAHIRAERVCLLMADAGTGTLAPAIARRSDGGPDKGLQISRTAIDTAVQQRLAIIAVDALVDERFGGADSIRLAEIGSLMCAPLFSGERLMGALYVDNGLAHQFSEADLELFTALANYAAMAMAQTALADQLAEERRRRERLQRYHSPAVVDRILAQPAGGDLLAAEERDISVLFADIVEFTSMAESMPAAGVAELLNTFLSRTADAIFAEQGTIDKFLGDAILAVFGAPLQQSDHALRAVRAAQTMRRIVTAMNAEGTFPPVRVRYTINSGVAIVGDIGPEKRQEYTVLGDVVNIGARLKALAAPDQLIISRATYQRITPPIPATVLGEFAVRGRLGKVEVLSVDP
jgi:adenylate cyclase